MNADVLIKGNLFVYCNNNPVIFSDSNGKDIEFLLDNGLPITQPVLSDNNFGTHSSTEKIPRQYAVSALIQMTNDPNLEHAAWIYGHTMTYGIADCNGIVRSIIKSFYTLSAYNSILGKETTVSGIVPRIQISEPIPITDKDTIPACSIVISKDYSHMGMTIGPYQDSNNAIVESAIRFGKVRVSQDWKIGDRSREFYYYCLVSVIDYNTEITHTGPRYLTVEDD